MLTRIRPSSSGFILIFLLASIHGTVGCVSSARYRSAVAQQERLAKENLELQRNLAEERVRAQEVQDALAGRRPGDARGATGAQPGSSAGGVRTASSPSPALAPEGLSAPTPLIGDEDVTASAPAGGNSATADGLLRVAQSYASAGNTRQAIDAYTRLIADNPFSPVLPQAFLERGRLRLRAGERKGALEDFDTVVEAFPASPQASEARRQGGLLRH
jgi:tetratricopeptide (TPR) repeat protein